MIYRYDQPEYQPGGAPSSPPPPHIRDANLQPRLLPLLQALHPQPPPPR